MAKLKSNTIRLSKSCLSKAEKKAVIKVLDKEYLGMGLEVKKFEEELTEYFNRPAVCVVNGTAALHLALQAIGLKKNDEVLVQSLTYISCLQSISAVGANPVLCDINPESITLNCNDAEKKITKNTKAIMPVHYAGQVGDLKTIYQLGKKKNLTIIEDASHAFGSIFNKKPVGSSGDISCFSFDGIKNITSGEGGCVVTDNKLVLSRVKNARLLGVENDTKKRFSNKRSWEFDVKNQGWRYHMSDVMAAIGRVQLKRREELALKRQSLSKLYHKTLSKNKKIKLILKDFENVVPHIFPIRILNLKNRNLLRKNLLKKYIETGIHYIPNHNLTLYSSTKNKSLFETEKIHNELLTLPLHPDLKNEQVKYICANLNELIE